MKNFMNYDFIVERIIIACYVAPGKGTAVHNNRSSHGIAIHPDGDRYYIFDNGRQIHAEPNTLVYLPKGSNYSVKSVTKGCCYAINFDVSETIDFSPFAFKLKNPSVFFKLFSHAESVWRKGTKTRNLIVKSDIYNIFANLVNEYELGYISSRKSDLLLPAIEFIHSEYAKKTIDIPYLSELCGISETYFRRFFKRKFGIPPIKYINDLKISRAKELIASNLYSVSEVAELSGFHDESYFSREFKKAVGVSPSEYAQR